MTIWTVPARIVRVVDGDTLLMDLDLGWKIWRMSERCRLSGINAPELDTDAGKDARDFLVELLGAHLVAKEPSTTFVSRALDKYGRPLGIVRLADGRILNDLILSAGHATPA